MEMILVMWDDLDERDETRVLYNQKFKGKLSFGRFQVPKGKNVAPGVEMSGRTFLGSQTFVWYPLGHASPYDSDVRIRIW